MFSQHTDLAVIRQYEDGRIGLLSIVYGHDDASHLEASRRVTGWRGVFPDADIRVVAGNLDTCRQVNNTPENILIPKFN